MRSGGGRFEGLVRLDRDQQIDLALARGFEHHPERLEELAEAHRLGVDAIDDEPWEPWWSLRRPDGLELDDGIEA